MENLLSDAMLMDLYPVCDYWQLITDGPIITINNPIEILYNDKVYLPSEIDRRLIIGKKITSELYVENEFFELTLQNALRIRISLWPDDYVCPEAVCISNSKTGIFVAF